ncbi:MAG: GNAT family N-acetyltransferase [Anaerolineaceae bacterium]|nr:GNAT family N-acetyltransferase [Anaerolineaceae bacterium]
MSENLAKSQIQYRWLDPASIVHEDLVKLLQQFGDLTPEPLSNQVDLDEYAIKWLCHADILLAYDGDQIVGIRILYANDQETKAAHGLLLAVLPSHRNLGIARELYQESLVLARERGMTNINLFTHHANIKAINLFKSLGFVEVGKRKAQIEMRMDL